MDTVEIVRKFYDDAVETEWERLEHHKVEFELNKRFILRYIKPGDRVLDMGGGPGRYSLFLAEYGGDVTLADLSQANVDFALEKAREKSLPLKAVRTDARKPSMTENKVFDHILLMGPLYHLTEEKDRIGAVNGCLQLLKPGGTLFCSFISSYAGIIYMMKYEPSLLASNPQEEEFMRLFVEDKPFSGMGFTRVHLIRHADVLQFMSQFPIEKLHFLSSEGMLAPCEPNILSQPPEVVEKWLNLAEQVCEREDLLSFAEHYLYVGRKR